MVTYFVVQGFQRGRRGAFIADQPREARDEMHAKRMAQRLAPACDGVSRSRGVATRQREILRMQ